ncbi:hypothetical protein M9H77_17509 [Catharanthus roseus]|uniref:Uncharacterized protein n=1 Tax=Catharanthus roseus TaxID=4058 RepID=A0ACC0B4V0_CATRO|nr:hypothetical protein M9H77_17509 [Catharanthus roseus]
MYTCLDIFWKILSLPVVENLGTEVLSIDAHPVHHFIDELSLIAALPPLTVESLINQSMEDIDERIEEDFEGEHNAQEKRSFGSDLEVIRVTPSIGLSQGRKTTRVALKEASS